MISADPRRRAILARIRAIWRHLPPRGRLLFFDVKPVAVKAYGGRRFSRQRRLTLAKRQKTRGRFQLFVLYDVLSGRVHWAYCPSKDSAQICAFMERVRRWYPQGPLWIVLDQDGAHPRKCARTRQAMRALRLHWISLPKGSPDDNPVETIFSLVQSRVLEASDVPDVATMRRRISALLRGRNRRHDRRIKIHYLPRYHKT